MRGIGRKEKKALMLQASRFAFESFDLAAWHEGVLRTADRLGLMMAGDVALSAQALAGGEPPPRAITRRRRPPTSRPTRRRWTWSATRSASNTRRCDVRSTMRPARARRKGAAVMADPRKPPGPEWDPAFDDAEIFVEQPTAPSLFSPLPSPRRTTTARSSPSTTDGDHRPSRRSSRCR